MNCESEQEQDKLRETKLQLKGAEQRCTDLYNQMNSSNKEGIDRWQEIQLKYEESQSMISKQQKIVEELNQQIHDLKDINNKIDFSWSSKYHDEIKVKDDQIMVLERGAKMNEERLESEHTNEVKKMKLQFRDDIVVIDRELNKQINMRKEAFADNEKLKKQVYEMQTLLQAAASSDEKKTAMLDELKVAVQQERQKIGQQKSDLDKDKSQLDEYKRIKEEENLSLVRLSDQQGYTIKEQSVKYQTLQERFNTVEVYGKKKELQIESLEKELQILKARMEKDQQSTKTYEEQLKSEVEDARVEIEDLTDLLKTKDRMLEDQNIVISDTKEKNKEKDAETKTLTESKQKYRDFYEEKLQVEYDEGDKLRARNDDLVQQLQQIEYDTD